LKLPFSPPDATTDALAELLPGFLYWLWMKADGSFCYPYASKAAETWLGQNREQLKLDGSPLLNMIHPDDYDWVLAESMEAAESGALWCAEFRMCLPNGDVIWLEARDQARRLEDGGILWIGYSNDITERKQLEKDLQRTEARFRGIVESASDLIYIFSPQYEIIYASPACSVLSPSPLNGHPVTDWLHPDDVDIFLSFSGKSFSTGDKQKAIECRFRHAEPSGDQWRWHSINISPLLITQGRVQKCLAIARDIDDKKHMLDQIEHMASYDQLTNLPNRGLFFRLLNQALSHAKRKHRKVALMFMDIDNFKPVNDNLGHAVGDQLLSWVAHQINGCLRESDSAGRVGGDEFVVFMPDLPPDRRAGALALSVAERIRLAMSESFTIDGHALNATCSIGIAIYPDDGLMDVQLVKCADRAMYLAKANGRDQSVLYAQNRDQLPVNDKEMSNPVTASREKLDSCS
jgi:diguanylate cyclase (GGDEF)-like protein/PAS domain S-box-containing protein